MKILVYYLSLFRPGDESPAGRMERKLSELQAKYPGYKIEVLAEHASPNDRIEVLDMYDPATMYNPIISYPYTNWPNLTTSATNIQQYGTTGATTTFTTGPATVGYVDTDIAVIKPTETFSNAFEQAMKASRSL